MFDELRGKPVKIVVKDGDQARVVFGRVVWASDTFLAEKDRYGKMHFLNMETILKISEVCEEKIGEAKIQTSKS